MTEVSWTDVEWELLASAVAVLLWEVTVAVTEADEELPPLAVVPIEVVVSAAKNCVKEAGPVMSVEERNAEPDVGTLEEADEVSLGSSRDINTSSLNAGVAAPFHISNE